MVTFITIVIWVTMGLYVLELEILGRLLFLLLILLANIVVVLNVKLILLLVYRVAILGFLLQILMSVASVGMNARKNLVLMVRYGIRILVRAYPILVRQIVQLVAVSVVNGVALLTRFRIVAQVSVMFVAMMLPGMYFV